ncbi:MAG: hypothetical protein U0794_04925 [Isosphaeraceae bacterium]
MLIKLQVPPDRRAEVVQGLVQIFRGRIVDGARSAHGREDLRPGAEGSRRSSRRFAPTGSSELARTGRIALVRGSRPAVPVDETSSPELAASKPPAVDDSAVVGHSSP